MIAKAVQALLKFYPPLDVIDPETFIAGIGAVLAKYPPELIAAAVAHDGVPMRIKNLRSLAELEQVCSDLYDPIARRKAREAVTRQALRIARAPRSAEQQAAVDEQVMRVRKHFGLITAE